MAVRRAPHGRKCTVSVCLDDLSDTTSENYVEDPDLRQWVADFIDGKTEPRATTHEVVTKTAEQFGWFLTEPIVRRHRRRITNSGESCWCPK